jgi:hypothetical protein
MLKITLIYEEDDKDVECGAELDNENISIYNVFKALEACLLELGFTCDEISEYYFTEMNDKSLN